MALSGRLLIPAALVLAVLSTLATSWVLPLVAIHAAGTRWDVGRWGIERPRPAPDSDLWWADSRAEWPSPRAGHYFVGRHLLLESVDMRRIIFTGALEEKSYFRRNSPPRWAATLSTDMREGFEQVITTASGWPLRCFRGEQWISWRAAAVAAPAAPPMIVTIPGVPSLIAAPAAPAADLRRGLWVVRHHGSQEAAIPHQVIWRGLIGNVAVFGLAWGAIFFVPAAGRRVVRRWRGRCPRCDYDLRGMPGGARCPECGRAGTVTRV